VDPESKDRLVRRYLRHAKRQRTRDEEKEIEEHVRRRKAGRRGTEKGVRRRAPWWPGGEEVEGPPDGGVPGAPPAAARRREALAEDAVDAVDLPVFEKMRKAERLRLEPRRGGGDALAGVHDRTIAADLFGQVAWVGRGRVRLLAGGVTCDAVLGARLARAGRGAVAVGDHAACVRGADGALRAVRIVERRTWLARAGGAGGDTGGEAGSEAGSDRVLAANVDVAVLVVAARQPPLRPGLVDRFLIAVQRGGVQPLVCANKVDLLGSEADRAELAAALAPYPALGVAVLQTSTVTGEGLAALRAALAGKTCALVGHSGVGKSSLLNALHPHAALRTGEVRERDGKGRHTTVSSSLFELDERGTRLIDTPGVRAFGLGDVSRAELEAAFPEIAAAAGRGFARSRGGAAAAPAAQTSVADSGASSAEGAAAAPAASTCAADSGAPSDPAELRAASAAKPSACRFADCRHLGEPDCAVRAAVDGGAIARARYDSYVRILEG
jgi:ribosome biogenesis GTPase